ARFGRPAGRAAVSSSGAASANRRSRWWGWSLTPVMGAAAAAVVAVVAVVGVTSGGGAGRSTNHGVASSGTGRTSSLNVPHGAALASTPSAKAPGAAGAGGSQNIASSAKAILGTTRAIHGAAGAKAPAAAGVINQTATSSVQNGPATFSPAPVPNGRKLIQSSVLQLGAPASRIDAVAQGVFNVVGAVSGIVDRSNVSSTALPGASAQFQLRIPSAQLPLALTDLSRLRYAHVISRTDNTQDVNSSFVSAQRQIAGAQAALARLRTQLAAATLATQIATLRAQIANEQATIAQAQASLRSLGRQVDYSRVSVSIQATTPIGGGTPGGGGGFGLHKAGHDALRVLEVTAGVALIALAVLVPLGLLAAVAWWLAAAAQRRRRERTLDLA
ncbi:MAG: DUF4349 domain-containing protein, partial [Actinomycetota bacterium]|nr:DUF4349 domain-containing protein [Actinomycetota bacterium]